MKRTSFRRYRVCVGPSSRSKKQRNASRKQHSMGLQKSASYQRKRLSTLSSSSRDATPSFSPLSSQVGLFCISSKNLLHSKLVLNHFSANCSKNDPHDFVSLASVLQRNLSEECLRRLKSQMRTERATHIQHTPPSRSLVIFRQDK